MLFRSVIDEAGNETVCESIITVLDKLAPTALCQDVTVYLNGNGVAVIRLSDIDNGSFDNCGIDEMWLSKTTFGCRDLGDNTVTLFVRDASGNIDSCTAIVTVIDDQPPVAICRSIDLYLGPGGRVTLSPTMVDGGSYDEECGIERMDVIPATFDCSHVGSNQVTLYVWDPAGNIDSCTAIVNIIGNVPPVANDDRAIVPVNQTMLIIPLTNDFDPNGRLNPATFTIITPPQHGSLVVDSRTGSVSYRPDENYLGNDAFTYSICDDGNYCEVMCDTAVVRITVVEGNNPPIAVNDTFRLGCLPINGNILLNDIDPDGDRIELSPYLLKQPTYGRLDLNPNGSFTYFPTPGFVGTDIVVYEICDDGFPSMCDTATVVFIIFEDKNCDGEEDEGEDVLFIPEGFSPNNDGVHDYFQIVGIEKFPDAKMYIFNRWGNKLFEKEHYGNLNYWGSHADAWWDGYSDSRWNVGGGRVPVGNYLYILELGNGKTFKGTVMVSY